MLSPLTLPDLAALRQPCRRQAYRYRRPAAVAGAGMAARGSCGEEEAASKVPTSGRWNSLLPWARRRREATNMASRLPVLARKSHASVVQRIGR